MIDKIKNLIKSPLAKSLADVRVLGFALFGVLVLLVSWSGVGVIQTNYDLEKQVSKLAQENQVSVLSNENLKLRNKYYETDDYLELAARRQFGKALPGETLLIVPQNIAMGYTKDLASAKSAKPKQLEKPFYQQNFQAWMDFFLHRRSVID